MKKTLLTLMGAALLLLNINANAQSKRIGYGDQLFPDCEWLLNMKPSQDIHVNTVPGRNGGTGTQQDPYIVSTAEDLAEIAIRLNSGTEAQSTIFPNGNTGYTGQYFLMDADIDLSDYQPWTPISVPGEKIFFGHFDGGNHAITHLATDKEGTNQGLFSVIGAEASISNLSIRDSFITGMMYTGAIVGAAGTDSYIYNCHNYCDVEGGHYYIGGITGATWGTIQQCTNCGNISTASDFVGGMVGDFYGTLTECVNTGDITGQTSVGGLVGYSANATMNLCLNAGNIYAGSGYTGGCVGFVTNYGTDFMTSMLVNVGNNYGQYVRAVIGRLWKEGDEESHAANCYYDCQMTDKKGVNPGNDVEGVVEPRYTHEMLGDQLASLLSYSFGYHEGMYPCPNAICEQETAIIAATPANFRFASADDFDRFDGIKDDFEVTSLYDFDLSCENGRLTFDDGICTLVETGEEVLTISSVVNDKFEDRAKKVINIEIIDMLGADEMAQQNAVNVYPNPSSSLIFIESEEGTVANLYSLDGRMLTRTDQGVISVSNFESGNYILVLTKGAEVVARQKVVICK